MTTPDLSEFRNNVRAKPCIVARWQERLSTDDLEKFVAAQEAKDISTSSIFRWTEKREANFRLNALMVHRRKGCSCQRI